MKYVKSLIIVILFICGMAGMSIILKQYESKKNSEVFKATETTEAKDKVLDVEATPPEDVEGLKYDEETGQWRTEGGGRYVDETEDAYRTWEATSMNNHIDNPYVEEIDCLNWLIENTSVKSSDISWVSWYAPAADDGMYDTILIKTVDNSIYYVRRHSDTMLIELVDNPD